MNNSHFSVMFIMITREIVINFYIGYELLPYIYIYDEM